MPRSTTSSPFPDVNVWIALTYREHVHYPCANDWLKSVPDDMRLCFCRLTQIGFLRLLTTPAVMGHQVLTQAGAWKVYDEWLSSRQAEYVEEPPALDPIFRSLSQSNRPAPKDWADSYLSAFAEASRLTLITFDQALSRRTSGAVLLMP